MFDMQGRVTFSQADNLKALSAVYINKHSKERSCVTYHEAVNPLEISVQRTGGAFRCSALQLSPGLILMAE